MNNREPMTLEEAIEYVGSLPWRLVGDRPEGPAQKPPDLHWYVIGTWDAVDDEQFWRFIDLVRSRGRRGSYVAPYRPDRTLYNRYLELGPFVYWFIGPAQLARTRTELQQHEWLDDP